jgi:protein-L-isoaspartate(D-aspartate) O-methyltransferase
MVNRFSLFRFSLLGLVLASGTVIAQEPDSAVYRERRLKMVEEFLAREGVSDEAVLKAMSDVPRHQFVPPNMLEHAYKDWIIPMGYKQTVSPPYIVAYMTQTIDPRPQDKVLEIGTGSGYQAAILSKLVREVYTIEIVEPLAQQAAERLRKLGFANVHCKAGDGYKGWPEHAPFDKIIVTCSPEDVPGPLVEQLKEGGKMIIPLGERFQQAFYLFEKRDGKLVRTRLQPTQFVPMTGQADTERKRRADAAHPRLINGSFEHSSNGRLDNWYYQRQLRLEHHGAREGESFVTFTNHEPGRDSQALQAIGIDGGHVRSLRFSLWVKANEAAAGNETHEQPALLLTFYDIDNMPLGSYHLGPWLGTFAWKHTSQEIPVPRQTHMAVVRLGLNGGTGSLSVDDVRMLPRPRGE